MGKYVLNDELIERTGIEEDTILSILENTEDKETIIEEVNNTIKESRYFVSKILVPGDDLYIDRGGDGYTSLWQLERKGPRQ